MTDLRTDLPTVCVLCSHNCGLRVDVAGRPHRRRARRRDEPDHEGLRLQQGVRHRALRRARRPRALPDAPARRRHLRGRSTGTRRSPRSRARLERRSARAHSPRAIALVGIGGQGNHMDAPYAMAFLRGIGSRRWFNAFAQEKTQHNLLDQWMFDASPATFLHADTERARFLLVLGTNPKISNRGHNADRHLQDARRRPDAHRRRRRSARDRDHAHGDAPSARAARHRRRICCSRWRR